jgi:thioredoxin
MFTFATTLSATTTTTTRSHSSTLTRSSSRTSNAEKTMTTKSSFSTTTTTLLLLKERRINNNNNNNSNSNNGRNRKIIQTTTRAGLVEKMNAEQLEIAMADRSTPLVIDFYATWCGPCVLMSAELEKVQKELGADKVRCIKVDTDEETELASQLAIEGLPTLVFVSKNAASPALRTEGMIPAETVINIIQQQLQ